MKKVYYKIISIGFVVLFLFAGCTKNFEEINTDPNSPSEIPPQYLLTSAQKVLMWALWDEWWNGRFGCLYSQYFSQTSYTDESRYKYRDGVNNNYWIYFYAGRDVIPDGTMNGGGMEDLEAIIRLNTDPETAGKAAVSGDNNNQIGVAKILKAWMFQIMTDVWGDIPYTQALQGAEYPMPAYDQQMNIYPNLIVQLDEAIGMIDITKTGVAGDQIYGGDMQKWIKFAYSLKLRIALRMAGKNEVESKTVIANSYTHAFADVSDNAQFPFLGGVPNNNPLNENQKTRQDFACSKTLINLMNGFIDPRLPFFANKPVDDPEGPFIGFPYGMTQDEATPLATPGFSMPGNCVYAPQSPGMLMNYDEVCFIIAEAANNGWISEDAGTWYENGIKASMMMWNGIKDNVMTDFFRIDDAGGSRTWPESITEIQMNDYLLQSDVKWDAGNADYLLAAQKYIALYPQGLQGWFEYNRTGMPALFLPGEYDAEYDYTFTPLEDVGGQIPLRMEYPSEEQTLNGASYDAAVGIQGADLQSTRLWWQIPFN